MAKKQAVQVDEADVQHMINFMFGKTINMTLSAEERADGAYEVALGISLLQQRSRPYAEALAKKVRDKAVWLKAPTGHPEEMPD